MSLILDHLFFITGSGGAIADQFRDLGWAEGSSNTHPGQGTSNRRFFFGDFVLEVLFVSDAEEAASGTGKNLQIVDRSLQPGACPLGIVVRTQGANPVFPHWKYYPDYFPENMFFSVGDNSGNFTEPLCICMPIDLPKKRTGPGAGAEIQNNSSWVLSSVEIDLPLNEMSTALEAFSEIDNIVVCTGKSERLTLVFNHGVTGSSKDLEVGFPVTVRW